MEQANVVLVVLLLKPISLISDRLGSGHGVFYIKYTEIELKCVIHMYKAHQSK